MHGWTSRQRNAAIASFLSWTLDAFDFFLLVFLLSDIAHSFHVDLEEVTLAILLTLAVRPVGALIFGRAAEKFGRKPILMLNIVFFSAFELLSAAAPSLMLFFLLRVLYGVAMGGIWGVASSLAMETIPDRSRGLMSGLFQAGYPFGYLLAAVAYGLLFTQLGWRGMFVIGAAPVLLLPFIYFCVEESPVWLAARQSKASTALLPVLRSHWKLCLYLVVLMAAFNFFSHGTQDLYPVFLKVQHGFEPKTVSIIAVCYNIASIIGGVFFGSLSEKIGRRKAIMSAALLALPVIVQNLITTSLGFLDTFMVGLLGSDQMSAVTVANVPVFIIQLVVFGLQSGSSVLISQYWGRGDRESINRVMGIGFMIAGGVSVLFAAILCAFPAQVLYLITDNLTLVELAEPYLRIVGFSYIFNSLSSIYIGMQRSIENPRFGMIVFAISMLCNTLGNYVLIFGKLGLPALGITGAAVATLLSRVVEFVVAFSYAFHCRTMPLMKHAIFHPGMDMLRKFLRYSAPVLINETLWGTGFSMITVIMGHMANSSDLIAAYTLAGNIDKLMTSGVFGIAAAVSVIVGKEIGTGNLKGVYNIGRALCFTAFAFGIVLGIAEYTMFVTLMQPFVMPLFSLSAVAERLCTVMLTCYACAIPLHSFSTTMAVGVLRGGGDVNASLVIDNVPLWFGTLPLMCLLGLVLKVPNEVFCLCLMIEYILKTPLGLIRLRSGKWVRDLTKG
mgnify:CR=1 FL=1